MDADTEQAAWHDHDENWIRWSDEKLREETKRILSYWCVVKWNGQRAVFEVTEEGYGEH